MAALRGAGYAWAMRSVLLLAMMAAVACETSTAPRDSAPWVTDHAPTTPAISLTPEHPGVGSTLHAELVDEARDADLDPVTYRYVWAQNGAVVLDGPDADVGPDLTAEGDEWTVQLYAGDGTLESASEVVATTIHEVPPVGPDVAFAPNPPLGANTLFVRELAPATDVNDDPLEVTWQWYRNDVALAVPDGTGLTADEVSGGDRFRVVVTTTDGNNAPVVSELTASIPDLPPTITEAAIYPSPQQDRLPLTCSTDATDPDSLHAEVTFGWYLNRVFVPEAGAGDTLSADLTEVGDQWQCEVSVTSDGVSAGPLRSNPVEIRDSYGFRKRQWAELTVSTDPASGERTGTGRVEVYEGRESASAPTTNACDLYWSLVATEDPSVCADCTHAFSVSYTYDAAASSAGDFCADHPGGDSDGTVAFRTETAAFTAVLDDAWSCSHPVILYPWMDYWRKPLPIAATGTGANPGIEYGTAWAVTEGTDVEGNVTISAYTFAYYYY